MRYMMLARVSSVGRNWPYREDTWHRQLGFANHIVNQREPLEGGD